MNGRHPRVTGFDPPDVTLSAIDRAVTRSVAVGDVGLRMVGASLVAATLAPFAVRGDIAAELDRLAFYAELANRRDARASFVAPDGPPPDVVVTRKPSLVSGRLRGRVELLRFTSRYVPHHPDLRERWRRPSRNQTMWVQHWRHADGPRPTLIVSHGFMASGYLVNSTFFSLPWFYSHGYDVALVTLPFHGRRTEPRCSYSGAGLFGGGLSAMNESMFQAVHDIRSLLDHLGRSGVERVGMTGLSLGGYTTAMMAAADDRLEFAIPNCAVVDLPSLIDVWSPAGTLIRNRLEASGADADLVDSAMRVHSPLTYPARLPVDRLFIVHGLGDRLAPPEQGQALAAHWGNPRMHWFAGSHTLHVRRDRYLREMGRFFNEIGFGAPLGEDADGVEVGDVLGHEGALRGRGEA